MFTIFEYHHLRRKHLKHAYLKSYILRKCCEAVCVKICIGNGALKLNIFGYTVGHKVWNAFRNVLNAALLAWLHNLFLQTFDCKSTFFYFTTHCTILPKYTPKAFCNVCKQCCWVITFLFRVCHPCFIAIYFGSA